MAQNFTWHANFYYFFFLVIRNLGLEFIELDFIPTSCLLSGFRKILAPLILSKMHFSKAQMYLKELGTQCIVIIFIIVDFGYSSSNSSCHDHSYL